LKRIIFFVTSVPVHGPPILLFIGNRNSFLELKRPGREIDDLTSSIAQVNKECFRVSSPTIEAFMAWAGKDFSCQARSHNCEELLLASSLLSVCPHATFGLQLHGFL